MEKDNDELKASAPTEGETGINTAETDTLPDMPAKKQKKKKLSGAYYYTETDEAQLAKASFNRTLAAVIALLLQIVVLMLPQGGLEYVTRELPSYAYAYMWAVFVMLIASVYVIVMNMTRCKLKKRIPKEYAPRRGFKRRTFFSSELYIAVNALIFVIELSFVHSLRRHRAYGYAHKPARHRRGGGRAANRLARAAQRRANSRTRARGRTNLIPKPTERTLDADSR